MLVPLTLLDTATDAVELCMCFVFALPSERAEGDTSAFLERLKSAADRVVRKWSLLTGVPRQPKPGVWAIDVPDDVDGVSKERALFGFTTASLAQPYHEAAGLPSALRPLSSTPTGFLPAPKLGLFRPQIAPKNLADRDKSLTPLLHLHTTVFSDALAVGVNLPHGVFDGTGCGKVLKALDAELHGRDLEPAPVFAVNPLDATLVNLRAAEPLMPPGYHAPFLHEWCGSAWIPNLLRFLSSLAWEKLWWKSEQAWVLLRDEDLQFLVARTREEVKQVESGGTYVSTGDVVTAWLLKAAHSAEAHAPGAIRATGVMCGRSILSSYSSSATASSLSSYPFNAAFGYSLLSGTLPLTELASLPLATLALRLRRSLDEQRNLPALQAVAQGVAANSTPTRPLLPYRDWPQLPFFSTSHTHSWVVTNQTSLDMASLSFPGTDGKDLPLLLYYQGGEMPLMLDHVLPTQRVPGVGITLCGLMRRSRWKSLAMAVGQLKEEAAKARA
ncbi:hypothetical protein JCM10213v2_004782 [Rhodosporidiobolus nylandii]